jgi:hypothetical protein
VTATTPDRTGAFTAAVLNNAVLDSYARELYTFLFPHEFSDSRIDGSLPPRLAAIEMNDNDNPLMLKISLKIN